MTREEAVNRLEKLCEVFSKSTKTIEAIETVISSQRGPTREMVERMLGEWEDMREAYKDVPKRRCSCCKSVFIGLDTPFCEACGAPMTDEAVEMVMERWKEAVSNEA